jgi:hypothetical protein
MLEEFRLVGNWYRLTLSRKAERKDDIGWTLKYKQDLDKQREISRRDKLAILAILL